jgi:hypothetical protein
MAGALDQVLQEEVVGALLELAQLLLALVELDPLVERDRQRVVPLIDRLGRPDLALGVVVEWGSLTSILIGDHQLLAREQRRDLGAVGGDHHHLLDAGRRAAVLGGA